jgi:uncharacterized membrane protein YoaT (DUF817 family)
MPVHAAIRRLDASLLRTRAPRPLGRLRRVGVELGFFALKEARACLFAFVIFGAVFAVPRAGLFGVARYDVLLAIALATQAWLLWRGLETRDAFTLVTNLKHVKARIRLAA